ncbi:hypothetical protein GCM10022630_33110 [Thermobifida alba]
MTLVRRGRASSPFDGDTHRWRGRHRPAYTQGFCATPLAFTVELADNPGQALMVTAPLPHPSN